MNFIVKVRAIALLSLLSITFVFAEEIVFERNKSVSINHSISEDVIVKNALEIFSKDFERVFDAPIVLNGRNAKLFIGTLGCKSAAERFISKQDKEWLRAKHEGFVLQYKAGKLIVVGSESRGTAFGILEISRMIGVSPWEWWADVPVNKMQEFCFEEGFILKQSPSVKYRGIFLNDEDWGIMPWSSKNYEPSKVKGEIGYKTHARIFELLLRLRANTLWPAMHGCSVPFYFTKGNLETARNYGIYIGTSHCEPMLRNTNGEWKSAERGEYNYLTNRDGVVSFWEERLKELKGSVNLFTLGLRGEHDFPMRGATTTEERKVVIDSVFKIQRQLIAKYINKDVTKVPQVFIPYKEVLYIYRSGLQVPDDVTLMWTDDNHGYLTYFPDSVEAKRSGGHGVYNHVSYWGAPHDYLWLASTHPALVYQQMKLAYDKNVRNYWILNVGDIKPAEYLTELFLDMAWDITSIENNVRGLQKHMFNWYATKFGGEYAQQIVDIYNEYYRLAYIRKPEFMANTRVEEKDIVHRTVKDLPWSETEVNNRLNEYASIANKINKLKAFIPAQSQSAWYQLVEYPVLGADAMNRKFLYGQLARHGLADWKLSDKAYDDIELLTEKYNQLDSGKWNLMMDFKPRRLPVFDRLKKEIVDTPLAKSDNYIALFNGLDYVICSGTKPNYHGLGYASKAISLPVGTTVTYKAKVDSINTIRVVTGLAPTHPVNGKTLRYSISVNGGAEQIIDYATLSKNEEWKVNKLLNQAQKETYHQFNQNSMLTVKIKALDEGIVLDQLKIYNGNVLKLSKQ